MKSYPIILDTDPGLDDAIAIAVLAASAKERLNTIITSYGNVSLSHTTENALRCCNLFEVAPCIIAGSVHPLNTQSYTDATHIHGADGLAGVTIPPANLPVIDENPINALYQRICSLDKVDYITLGPLTNLCLLLQKYPDVKQRLHHVYSMGGGIAFGNITPDAEFNIYCDPAAAKAVCDAQLVQTFVPLDTTHQVVLSKDDIDTLTRLRSMKSGYIRQLLLKNYETNVEQGESGCILHDASAVIAYLFPECFTLESCTLTVDPISGKMIKSAGNTHIITTKTDKNRILEILSEALI